MSDSLYSVELFFTRLDRETKPLPRDIKQMVRDTMVRVFSKKFTYPAKVILRIFDTILHIRLDVLKGLLETRAFENWLGDVKKILDSHRVDVTVDALLKLLSERFEERVRSAMMMRSEKSTFFRHTRVVNKGSCSLVPSSHDNCKLFLQKEGDATRCRRVDELTYRGKNVYEAEYTDNKGRARSATLIPTEEWRNSARMLHLTFTIAKEELQRQEEARIQKMEAELDAKYHPTKAA